MVKVININTYRRELVEKRVYGVWQRLLGESFNLDTRLTDLSDRVLCLLAQPGDVSTKLYYEMIMGALDYGPADRFRFLDDHQKMAVVDIHMFLADHGRFEMMQRLGWLKSHICLKSSLVAIVEQFEEIKTRCLADFPELVVSHPDYDAYQPLIPREKQVFIRRKLNDALEVFKKRIATP